METQYLVRKVETCPVCKGTTFLSNPDWQRINLENAEWMEAHTDGKYTAEALADWARRIKKQWPDGSEPPEEEECHECEGAGKIETWIDLDQALSEIAGTAPSGATHRVWCSCGKSTTAVWNQGTRRYEAQDDGWAFILEHDGWFCGDASHKLARVDVVDGTACYERMAGFAEPPVHSTVE